MPRPLSKVDRKHVNILGIRGIPAAHGGFETFAARLAPYLLGEGWSVSVYCQGGEGIGRGNRRTDQWEGIERIIFDTRTRGSAATVEFDLRCVLDVLRRPGVDLVLGYNTAIFNILQRLARRPIVMNMDGIEWKRDKWGRAAKVWFWLNEYIGAHVCSTPIADHPEIAAHLETRGCRRSVVIPYGSDALAFAPVEPLSSLSLKQSDYFVSICRIEPENSILEIVQAFVMSKSSKTLVILGNFNPSKNKYHSEILLKSNERVKFPGAIYDTEIVKALRFHCLAYVHGHRVGGTNPSLVEALGAGNPIIAHDNRFNRWTAGDNQLFFNSIEECAAHLSQLEKHSEIRAEMSAKSRERHRQHFTFDLVHGRYREVLESSRSNRK